MLSLLGFDISLVRFLPEREDKSELINTCITISFIFSLALTYLAEQLGISTWEAYDLQEKKGLRTTNP